MNAICVNYPPELLYTLLFGSDPRSKHFQEMIRAYNTVLSFASMDAQIDEQVTGTKDINNDENYNDCEDQQHNSKTK
ncbi:36090_t:CDS:2 [Gigaspora margarita]|uniref:36090_t:CDS:1 n=1 Tax=Gigaspora margarita TaxID=4874 RepID=A0ABN7UG46_GIGMA|nr:36090_t:CDS:2 [Gigaspora margarita]